VIAKRLESVTPSQWVIEWLQDPEHVARIGDPLRDVIRRLARFLSEEEVVEFSERAITRQLRELPIEPTAARWLGRAADSPAAGEALRSAALSLKNLAERPRTAQELHWWLMRSARALHASGHRVVPFLLRRKVVQRTIVEAALRYASAELRGAVDDADHPLRQFAVDGLRRFAARLSNGDPAAIAQVERVREALLESLETAPLVRRGLGRLRQQIEEELDDRESRLSQMIDQKLREAILTFLEAPEHRAPPSSPDRRDDSREPREPDGRSVGRADREPRGRRLAVHPSQRSGGGGPDRRGPGAGAHFHVLRR
jgi:uncharacterized membrane-anchored protein YjiN (DUF445 family)